MKTGTQYISKSALEDEIKKRKQDAINNCGGFKSAREHECDSCIVGQYEEMEEIIKNLEVKEVDLEKEIQDHIKMDKVEKIKDEIERRKSLADKQKNNTYFFARSDAYAELLNFIDSLEEKPY